MKNIFALLLVLFVHTATSAQLPSYLPPAGLIAWFPFTGNVLDSSGNGHNGTPHGLTSAAGRYGVPNTAYYFNGISDYIYVPPGTSGHETSTDIAASLTISAWVKSPDYFSSPSGQMQIYWRGDATPAHDPHMLYINGTDVRIRRDVDPGTVLNEVGTSISGIDTNFHMFTGTYDSASGVYSIYVDGMLRNTLVLSGLETYPTSTMYNVIGAVDSGTWEFFYGTMDELGIWNRALTPCEVEGLYYSLPNIITHQPANDTVVVAGTATFSITDAVPGTTYQWQENSGSGFINLTNIPPYSGVYTATLTVSPVPMSMSGRQYRCVPISSTCLTDTSYAGRLIVRPPAGLNNIHELDNITITPNPNNGSFTLAGTSADNVNISVEIIDLLGKVVYMKNIVSQNGVVNTQIAACNACSRGMYFVKIHTLNDSKILPMVVN